MTSLGTLKVTFETVTAEEELADVCADVVLNDKAAARMFANELADIKYERIQDDKALPLLY